MTVSSLHTVHNELILLALVPHVDSIKFSGKLIAGLSLLSTRIMRLAPADHNFLSSSGSSAFHDTESPSPPQDIIELLLPPGSLYILTGPLRFDYTHEILGNESSGNSSSGSSSFPACERRISIVLRDKILA